MGIKKLIFLLNWFEHNFIKQHFHLILLLFLSLIYAACNSTGTEVTTPVPSIESATLIPTVTLTPAPTDTSEPDLVVLIAQPGADENLKNSVQNSLSDLSAQNGMRFEVRSEFVSTNLVDEIRLSVFISPDPGIAELAELHPNIQFLAIGIPNLEPTSNLSLISSGGEKPDQLGFIAGYLATVITSDWRVGVISTGDTPFGQAARQGFLNGVVFYCGLCRPVYPPFYQYPIYYEITSGASPEENQVAADFLIGQAVKTVYIAPGAENEDLYRYLAEAGVNLIGEVLPPSAAFRNNWAASVSMDLSGALREIWPNLINGEGGINLDSALVVSDQNEILFSPGKQRLVDEILNDLIAGYIGTGVDSATGESQ